MKNEVLVSINQLDKRFGNTLAVQGVSFEVKRGEVLGFLGPNGAGKSTTMQIIAGTLAPSGGQVLVNGVDILDRPKQAKRQIGFLPEHPPLYRELTVNEYLRYCGALHGLSGKDLTPAMDRVKERCGLRHEGERLIGNLSKGYQQRVGIAQAIIHAPAVVILDEPTVGLDPNQIREIRQLIRELGGDHSVILCTHILPEVQAICDRVQIIHQGRLVLNEQVDQLSLGREEAILRVGLRQPPAQQQLLAISGVEGVTVAENGQLLIQFQAGMDPTRELVNRSVEEGWDLFELTPQQRSLEEIFVHLTCGDEMDSPRDDNDSRPEVTA